MTNRCRCKAREYGGIAYIIGQGNEKLESVESGCENRKVDCFVSLVVPLVEGWLDAERGAYGDPERVPANDSTSHRLCG